MSWVRQIAEGLDLTLQYELEVRTSNDPGRDYTAHLLEFALRKRWQD